MLGSPLPSGSELLCCPVTGQHLDERDCDTESVKIGVDTILHMPPTRDASGSCAQATGRPQKMELQVLKLINLRSLDEGNRTKSHCPKQTYEDCLGALSALSTESSSTLWESSDRIRSCSLVSPRCHDRDAWLAQHPRIARASPSLRENPLTMVCLLEQFFCLEIL